MKRKSEAVLKSGFSWRLHHLAFTWPWARLPEPPFPHLLGFFCALFNCLPPGLSGTQGSLARAFCNGRPEFNVIKCPLYYVPQFDRDPRPFSWVRADTPWLWPSTPSHQDLRAIRLATRDELTISVMIPTIAAFRTRDQNRKLNLSFSHGRPEH